MTRSDAESSSDPAGEELQPYEDEHIEDPQSGVVRASVFGVSDGLVSNLAIVTGVAGGGGEPGTIIVAGVAGLLAGAFSMAAGEYVSMQTQRELLERELALEREHILKYPVEEEAHLARLLADNGLDPDDARRIASQVHRAVDPAVDFHALFELGFHPKFLGEPKSAALWSLVSFAVGASVPMVPWFVASEALAPSLALSAAALLVVGAVATRLTHRSIWYGAARQLLIGALTAGVTFAVGVLIAGSLLQG
jgi:VIT1/CCC1 family predicted Fe2+/Mn2+ transporter